MSKSQFRLVVVIVILFLLGLLALSAFANGLGFALSPGAYIELRDENGLQQFRQYGLYMTFTPPLLPTDVVTATQTPSASSTNSPSPVPSSTPTSSSTLAWVSPTPDIGTPSPTLPGPTATPIKQCQVITTAAFGIVLRVNPTVHSTAIGGLPKGTTVTLYEVSDGLYSDPYLWGHTQYQGLDGWFAIRNGSTWWIYGSNNTQFCDQIPGWPDGVPTPPPIVIEPTVVYPTATPYPTQPSFVRSGWGAHTVPGGDPNIILAGQQITQGHGRGFVVKSVNNPQECNAVEANGGTCIYRSLIHGDCPLLTNDPVAEAQRWMNLMVGEYGGVYASYFEIVNECDMGNGAWWNSFILEAVRIANMRGWKIVIPTLNPGVGDVEFWRPMVSALRAMEAGGHLLGLHDYAVYGDTLCDGSPYTAYRHVVNYYAICGEFGICNLGIALTEVGQGWGNSPPNVDDFVCWWNKVKDKHNVRFVSLWTAHANNTCCWPLANLDPVFVEMAGRIF